MRTKRWVPVLAFSLAIAASCRGGSEEAKAALLKAADHTLRAETFHIESRITLPEGKQLGVGDYVALDRFRMEGFGEGAAVTIQIGRDSYSTSLNLNRFFYFREPCDFALRDFFPALGLTELAEDVRRVGNTYRFEIAGKGDPKGRFGSRTDISCP